MTHPFLRSVLFFTFLCIRGDFITFSQAWPTHFCGAFYFFLFCVFVVTLLLLAKHDPSFFAERFTFFFFAVFVVTLLLLAKHDPSFFAERFLFSFLCIRGDFITFSQAWPTLFCGAFYFGPEQIIEYRIWGLLATLEEKWLSLSHCWLVQ